MRPPMKHEALLEGQTYKALEVRRLVYEAYKQGQGGHTTDRFGGQLSVQNTRLGQLSELFPKLFPEKLTKAAKEKLREDQNMSFDQLFAGEEVTNAK